VKIRRSHFPGLSTFVGRVEEAVAPAVPDGVTACSCTSFRVTADCLTRRAGAAVRREHENQRRAPTRVAPSARQACATTPAPAASSDPANTFYNPEHAAGNGKRRDREDEGHRRAPHSHRSRTTTLLFLARLEAASQPAWRGHGRPLLPQRLPRLRRRGRGPRRRRRPASRWGPGPALAPVRQALRPLPPRRAPPQGQGTPPARSLLLPSLWLPAAAPASCSTDCLGSATAPGRGCRWCRRRGSMRGGR
jgi:hypothetical protein